MPDIIWETDCASRSSDHTTLLCEIINDNFLTQLVKVPTREDNILDLVLVSSLDLVHDLTVGQPFFRSQFDKSFSIKIFSRVS